MVDVLYQHKISKIACNLIGVIAYINTIWNYKPKPYLDIITVQKLNIGRIVSKFSLGFIFFLCFV